MNKMKVNIAVCDDDAVFREMLMSDLNNYAANSEYDMNINSFSNGLELMISEIQYNLIFLDYKMGIMNGMETAKKLRNKGVSCPIIFVTGFNEIVYDVYEINAFRFIKKPVEKEVLTKALDDFFKMYKNRKTIAFVSRGNTVLVYSDEIVYVESKFVGCVVHTLHEFYKIMQSLNAFEALLPENSFFRCSNKLTINLKYVRGFEGNCVLLTNGEFFKIKNGAKLEAMKEAYDAYKDAGNLN